MAFAAALGILYAVIALLSYFDGQRLPQWTLSINITTLVSILSILFRAALLFVVAEVIGQAKWGWFAARPRPLYQLEHFEQVSR